MPVTLIQGDASTVLDLNPSADHTLDRIHVADAMRQGIISCGPEASLAEIARIMATRRVHAVAVEDATSGRPSSFVSDRDLISASVIGHSATAKNVAISAAFCITTDRSVAEAARVMSAADVSQLIVFSASGDYPVGVLSTGDVIAAYAVAACDPQREVDAEGLEPLTRHRNSRRRIGVPHGRTAQEQALA
jgi:CBS domain-containing protein